MPRLFGTDGVRGIAGEELTALLAYKIGLCTSQVLINNPDKKPRVLIGKDTRLSGDMLECAIASGLCANGSDAVLAGVLPTPAVAFLVAKGDFDAGIMISASHNPAKYNGIKIFNGSGLKLSDELEDTIEAAIEGHKEVPQSTGEAIGRVYDGSNLLEDYLEHISATLEGTLSGRRILIDCANGSASATARQIFKGHGAQWEFIHDNPDGLNINAKCGSTHTKELSALVVAGGYDIGIAFDGDADRCLMVDEQGKDIDGDKIMCVLADEMCACGELGGNTMTVTVLSNLGLHAFASQRGYKVAQTAVGDRFVLEEMLKCGYTLGGEQSGHIILTKYSTTGDGQLTAARILSVLGKKGGTVSELFGVMKVFPQVSVNVTVPNAVKYKANDDPDIAAAVSKASEVLAGKGRVLLRPSGTEPLVRIMLEGEDEESITAIAHGIARVVEEKLGR
ncbi:MAG: phosphoglucosamine mutase [Eubacteriales bacterium]